MLTQIQAPRLLAILNVTPDSFSDGAKFFEFDRAYKHASDLIEQGADMLDIGGDSTRPGSSCVGVTEELERIEELVKTLSTQVSISVDTHQAKTAHRCLELGASVINDISAGSDPAMFEVIAKTPARIVLMYMSFAGPHDFASIKASATLENIKIGLEARVERALKLGVRREQIILDTGMGGFLSRDPADSWRVIDHYDYFLTLGFDLLLGCSRKGFLKGLNPAKECTLDDLDQLSLQAAMRACNKTAGRAPAWLRVHNVAIHKAFFKRVLNQSGCTS